MQLHSISSIKTIKQLLTSTFKILKHFKVLSYDSYQAELQADLNCREMIARFE